MSLSKQAQTRIDVLRAALKGAQGALAADVEGVLSHTYFVRHPDGSVYDRKGVELRGPLVKLGQHK